MIIFHPRFCFQKLDPIIQLVKKYLSISIVNINVTRYTMYQVLIFFAILIKLFHQLCKNDKNHLLEYFSQLRQRVIQESWVPLSAPPLSSTRKRSFCNRSQVPHRRCPCTSECRKFRPISTIWQPVPKVCDSASTEFPIPRSTARVQIPVGYSRQSSTDPIPLLIEQYLQFVERLRLVRRPSSGTFLTSNTHLCRSMCARFVGLPMSFLFWFFFIEF